MRVVRATLVGAALTFAATSALTFAAIPASAQTGRPARPVSDGRPIISQNLAVPVFPGQMVSATLTLPTLEEAPLPAVVILAVREPGRPRTAAVQAVAETLLARGMAVVLLDVPPPTAESSEGEPLDQPADDAYAVLQFMREREDIDGDRVALVGIGAAAGHAARAAALDEVVSAIVLLGAPSIESDTVGLPTGLPLLSLPLETRVAPAAGETFATPITDTAVFLSRHLQ